MWFWKLILQLMQLILALILFFKIPITLLIHKQITVKYFSKHFFLQVVLLSKLCSTCFDFYSLREEFYISFGYILFSFQVVFLTYQYVFEL